ncbi:hypothetical protein Q8F99_26620, partial [Klebsiella pneumoniae]|nr:hypothetical protein [Klebsiella pneumoniae]
HKYLDKPDHATAFDRHQQQRARKVPRSRGEQDDTIMGFVGYTSPDGKINENNNWCRWKKQGSIVFRYSGLFSFTEHRIS